MSIWLQERLCQGNFAASVKAILPITGLWVPATPGQFRVTSP
jgi:hypothetical protein